MTKYRIIAVPDVEVSKCANCGASKNDGRKYVDFGLQVDFHGCVFLCGLCIKDIALNMGIMDDVKKEVVELRRALQTNILLQEQGLSIEKSIAVIFEEVKDYFNQLHSAGIYPPTDPSVISGSNEESDDARVSENEQGINSAESGTSKSDSGTGRKNVPSLTSLLDSP